MFRLFAFNIIISLIIRLLLIYHFAICFLLYLFVSLVLLSLLFFGLINCFYDFVFSPFFGLLALSFFLYLFLKSLGFATYIFIYHNLSSDGVFFLFLYFIFYVILVIHFVFTYNINVTEAPEWLRQLSV